MEHNDEKTKTHIFLAGTLGSSDKSTKDSADEMEVPVTYELVPKEIHNSKNSAHNCY